MNKQGLESWAFFFVDPGKITQFNKLLIVWACDFNCLVSPKFLKNLSVTGIQMTMSNCDAPGGGTPLYGLYGDVPLVRVWFLASLS